MKTQPPSQPVTLPPAWQAGNGLSIFDLVLNEAQKRGLAAHRIAAPIDTYRKTRNQLMIGGHRCEVLPGRILEPDEGHGEGMLRLHPAF